MIEGSISAVREPARVEQPSEPAPSQSLATRIYVNLAMPDQAEQVAALPVDGVGLLRAEFLLTEALGGEHPGRILARDGQESAITAMVSALSTITAAFAPRPVVYRTADFRSNEFRHTAPSSRIGTGNSPSETKAKSRSGMPRRCSAGMLRAGIPSADACRPAQAASSCRYSGR
ncbi:putative PEP-binding protein [Saccharopolyspora shandongensis]|uniref:putative PEP-binding protein n=1 Tax=Saccharopolyspora shandongensis TaxID=418495 RepID=UPI003449758B